MVYSKQCFQLGSMEEAIYVQRGVSEEGNNIRKGYVCWYIGFLEKCRAHLQQCVLLQYFLRSHFIYSQ